MSARTGPLSDVRVLDLTQALAGPYCTMLLADLGADVIKVEPPAGDMSRTLGPFPADRKGCDYGGYFASVNRNKRSIVLDLKTDAGRETFLRLVKTADAAVENARTGVMDRTGVGYERLREINPALVYAAIRGFGDPRTGASPYADWPAFDIVAQSMGGLVATTGPQGGGGYRAGPGVGDIYPGTLAALGVVSAVHAARRTGQGQFLDVAMYDAILALCEMIVYTYAGSGVIREPGGNGTPVLCPFDIFPTRDGAVAIAAPGENHWKILCEAIGRPGLATDDRTRNLSRRVANADFVRGLITEWTKSHATREIVRRDRWQGAGRPGQHRQRYFRGSASEGARHAGRGRTARRQSAADNSGMSDQADGYAVGNLCARAAPRRAYRAGSRRRGNIKRAQGAVMTLRLRRSELSTPASSPKMIEKAMATAADMVFLDLEDAVAPAQKEGARKNAVDALRNLDWGKKVRAVRVNGADTHWAHDDVIEVVEGAGDKLDVIIVPKPKAPRDIWFFDTLLTQLETKLHLKNKIGLEALIEESAALACVEEIAASSPRLEALILGFGDLSASQGMRFGVASDPANRYPGDIWHHARVRMITACRANGIDAIDGPFGNFRDADGYRREATWAATLGAVGKWAIHPSQIEIANDVFAPTPHEIENARKMSEAYQAATRDGAGAAGAGGMLVDAVAVRIFEGVLERARLTGRA